MVFFECFFPKCIRYLCTVVGLKHRFKKNEQDKTKLVVMVNFHIFSVVHYAFVKLELQNSGKILDSSGRARLFSKITNAQYFVSMKSTSIGKETSVGIPSFRNRYVCYRVNLCISPGAETVGCVWMLNHETIVFPILPFDCFKLTLITWKILQVWSISKYEIFQIMKIFWQMWWNVDLLPDIEPMVETSIIG